MNSRIVLVEDNQYDAEMILRAIQAGTDAQVEWLKDGEELLSYAKSIVANESPLPKVVLLDLKLPKVNGLEALAQFKAMPELNEIPVVVLTSSTEQSDIKAAYQGGANSYIVKPVSYREFKEVIESVTTYWTRLNAQPAPLL